ncbi:polyketide synthase dehydratase domain-containing protein, partial [Pseudomonas sp. R26(2017)]|uniref:polyketide synthase dehydratase domain-containing protein n=1 Tax=Pseudomonas sp. R26(2017) TaxID=1981695 RepID=UPI0015AAA29A
TADACGREHVMVCPSLREGRPEYPELLASLARLYCHGADLQWPAPGALLDLPSMGWNHQRYWTTALPVRANLGRGHDPLRHSLLGSRQLVRSAPPCDIWRTRLDFELRPYPGSHPICGVEILPAAALLNSFMQAGTRDGHLPTLRDVVLRTPVAVEGTRDIQIVRQGQQIRLCSRLDDEAVQSEQEREMGWLTHTTASLDWNTELQGPAPEVAAWQVDCPESLEWPQLEPMYRRRGIADYGFRWHIRSLRRGPGRLMATIQAQLGPSQANSWAVVLDAALTSLPLLLPDDDLLRMPAAIASLCARPTPPEIFTLFAELATRTGERQPIDLLVLDERGELAARIEGLVFMTVDRQDELAHGSSATVFVEDWETCRFEPPTEPLPKLVLLGSDDEAGQRLSLGLRRAGIEHARVRDGAELRLNGQPTLVLVLGSVPADDEALSDAVEANAWRLLQATQQVQRLALEQPSLRLGCVTFGVKAMANR